MKNLKRFIATMIAFCMVLTMLPCIPFLAASSDVGYHYELDTDGIDVGAQYLIVSGTVTNSSALRMDTSTSWQTSKTDVTVKNGTEIDAFENDNACLWSFSSATNGTVSCNGLYLNIEQYSRYQTTPATMQFTHFGNGAYGIYMHGGNDTNLQYLCYSYSVNATTWHTEYTYGKIGTDRTAYKNYVYLYKRVEDSTSFSVIYHGNGNTEGEAPDTVTGLESGTEHTLLAPKSELRKDIGNDTYLFRGWNTAADGSGTEYSVGDTITVTANVNLYAEWYLQTKYEVKVITDLDDVHTDLDKILGKDVTLYVRSDEDGSDFIELTKIEDGVYTAYVTENGTYNVYVKHGDEEPEEEHGHKVVIFNQNGHTELLNYSVTYDVNGGSWADGEEPTNTNQHANTTVTATENIPTREGYSFRGWKDGDGNLYEAGATVTTAITGPIVLTAQWDNLINVTVNVTVNHVPSTGGMDNDTKKSDVTFQLLQEKNGVNLPFGDVYTLDENHSSYKYDSTNKTTTYTVKINGLEQGVYNLSTAKSGYEVNIKKTTSGSGDETINVVYTYSPNNFDLQFKVKVNLNGLPSSLLPKAVNVKVTCWDNGYEAGTTEIPGWYVITQQAGLSAPSTVIIDENGEGSAFFTVWGHREDADGNYTYKYRVAVTSFVMPDGSILPAVSSEDHITYSPDGSGLYTANVSVEDGGIVPTKPAGSTTLIGAYFDGEKQVGTPTVNISVNPYTVTFDAGEGTISGNKTLVLKNQYKYPDISRYTPTPTDEKNEFIGWFVNDTLAENKANSYLTGNITYTAKYSPHLEISGDVFAEASYIVDGETVTLNDIDRIKKVMVVLQKNINGVYNDVDSQLINITYDGVIGSGEYSFENLPNDGTAYRIHIYTYNYISMYDNNGDGTPTESEYDVLFRDGNTGYVDAYLKLNPKCYNQWCEIDSSRINMGYRPTNALFKILYRDLGDIHPYNVIAQHNVPPYGLNISVNENGKGSGFYDVWNIHNNGTLYEYQLKLFKLYGNVENVFTSEGTEFTKDFPFTVEYGAPNYYKDGTDSVQNTVLKATLIPKQYKIVFNMNMGGETDHVLGMDKFHVDNGGAEHYAYMHTWSFADDFEAFPYREGYVFKGWTSSDEESVVVTDDGHIQVGAALAKTVTLTAEWEKLTGTDYTIRFLELNTDKVLHGATSVTGNLAGSSIRANDHVINIEGFVYAGAMINGTYYSKEKNPALTVSNNPLNNLMIIYYLPDGSDGYTEQVESNLSLNKTAVLENDGTYTITMETYTKDSPVTTFIQQNTPLDIVMVLDQSGSIIQNGYLDELQAAVNNFVSLIADHGRNHEVDHRIAMVGYAGDYDEPPTSTDTSQYPIAGGNTTNWVNTGVFDSNGDFHPYSVTGFNYTKFTGNPTANGIYYAYSEGEYLLLTHHDEYRHLITEDEARMAALEGTTVYGYINDSFVELQRNTSGLWLYGDKQLYSLPEFFTYHEDVWTHRKELEYRQIHAYGTGDNYKCTDGHGDLYQRTETTAANPQLSVYHDALVPVSVGANGSGGVNPGLTKSTSHLGSNGGTYVQYGYEMANRIFEANPLNAEDGRVRIIIMFTDGLPGIGTFDETVANEAIAQANIAKNTHNAYSYSIGLYNSDGVDAISDIAFYMNAVSSNYPDAQTMSDVKTTGGYVVAADGTKLNSGGPYYVKVGSSYYELSYSRRWVSSGWWGSWQYSWGYTVNRNTTYISDESAPSVSGGKVGGQTIYKKVSAGYKDTEYSGYYSTTDSEQDLKDYFAHVMTEITTKITKDIILHEDTILRDIMGQGLELTDGTVITAYTQAGTYNQTTGEIDWAVDSKGEPILKEMTSLTVGSGETSVTGLENVSIHVYNLDKENTTNPDEDNYHPHAVDITGYNFAEWFISDKHPNGYKIIAKITRIEARDDAEWGRSTATNYSESGLWLPADENGNRQLLLPFDQPTTIFVERAYVLDYGKSFTLNGWYFDSEDGKEANALHVDCDIQNGMNWFDEANPNTSNSIGGEYGNTKYGNVTVNNGKVTYTPVTSSWKGADSFYIFGNTWRKTVLAQDANENGNLWNKVTVIPANNVYYEDSFVTTEDTSVNGFEGFKFTGAWETVYTDDNSANAGQNTETPEHQEGSPYGNVHGWTGSLNDDKQYSDGSAHATGINGEMGASAEFTFTGTGIDVYTRTNSKSGMVVAMLSQLVEQKDADGNVIGVSSVMKSSKVVDNLSVSGDYYQIPTISFDNLIYGTYTVKLIATAATTATSEKRYEYYIDGVRVYNPIGNIHNTASQKGKDAYGKELNAVFTEVRDVLLDYNDFNIGIADDNVGKDGAVFIDWIQDGQGSGSDEIGTGTPSYEIGTFEKYGPKNEVYLSSGQAIVIKVNPNNNYYIGLKSLKGTKAVANLSGIDKASPVKIDIEHTTDMYYEVTPINGYIVIQNGSDDDSVLSVTKLRTTNMHASSAESGIEKINDDEAVSLMSEFSLKIKDYENSLPITPEKPDEETSKPDSPSEENKKPDTENNTQDINSLAQILFGDIRKWLKSA